MHGVAGTSLQVAACLGSCLGRGTPWSPGYLPRCARCSQLMLIYGPGPFPCGGGVFTKLAVSTPSRRACIRTQQAPFAFTAALPCHPVGGIPVTRNPVGGTGARRPMCPPVFCSIRPEVTMRRVLQARGAVARQTRQLLVRMFSKCLSDCSQISCGVCTDLPWSCV